MLETIMKKYFGAENCEDTEAYKRMIDCIYDIGSLVEMDVNEIVERLDDIANEQ